MSIFFLDTNTIYRAIRLLHPDGELFEIRLINGSYNASGYFTNANTAIRALQSFKAGWNKEEDARHANIFITMNPVSLACYSRKQHDMLIEKVKPTTNDTEITAFHWFLIDLDPKRISGVSSSENELQLALAKAKKVHDFLESKGWEAPIQAMSGNGCHLVYRFDEPNTPENADLWEKALKALQAKFGDDTIDIDITVFNPSRICKLWGTIAQKGTNTSERPHRKAYIMDSTPERIEINDKSCLENLVAELFPADSETTVQKFVSTTARSTQKADIQDKKKKNDFNILDFINKHQIPVRNTESTSDGSTMYVLEHCLFDESHTGKDAAIIQKSDGTLCYHCFHAHCADKHWKDVRLMYERDAYTQHKSFQKDPNLPYWITQTEDKKKVNAELLAKFIKQTEHYFLVQQKDQDTQRFFWYHSGVYSRISAKHVKARIEKIIQPYGENLAKIRVIEDTYTHLTYPDKGHFIADETLLDADENIINFQNGILHLDTMELKVHSPEYISTIQIPCNWNPQTATTIKTFDNYITHLANDDGDSVKTLLEAIGFVLSNVKIKRFKQAIFLMGQGNSGKSVFLEFMGMLIGQENYCAMPFEKLDKRFSASTLYRKRLAGDDDCNYCSFSNISTFKQITGGGTLQCEEKGKQAFPFIYKGLYIICANNLPLFGGDKGQHVYDRILPIQCGNSIPVEKRDKNLLEKLYAERESIVLAAVMALKGAIQNNYTFTMSDSSKRLLEQYMIENDIVLQFIEECCEKRTKFDKITTSVFYTAFTIWCGQNGEKYIPKKKEFTESVCRHFGVEPKDKKKIQQINNGFFYYPITLTSEAKQELHIGYDSVS